MFGSTFIKKKAVAYYRHSAEDKQENSVEIQQDLVKKFAAANDIEIIHEVADRGVTGLIAKRPAFTELFDDWVYDKKSPDFDYILVKDESRWGRWQEKDEAPYWTAECRHYGYKVIYATRGFPLEDDELAFDLLTTLNQHNASGLSKKLSDDVWGGCMKVSEQGYLAGGPAPFGYNRVLLDEQRNRISALKPGEHKMISNQRVILEPVSDEMSGLIRGIFDSFVNKWQSPTEIADNMNAKNILTSSGNEWNSSGIIRMLCNPVYTGARVYNRTWQRLEKRDLFRKNPPKDWVYIEDAFEAIVTKEMFQKAQEKLYWSVSSRLNRSARMIHQAKKQSLQNAKKLAVGIMDDDALFKLLRNLPIVFCALPDSDGATTTYYFRLPEYLQQEDEILGVVVDTNSSSQITAIFVLKNENFGIGNVLVVDESWPKLTYEEANKKFTELCRKFC